VRNTNEKIYVRTVARVNTRRSIKTIYVVCIVTFTFSEVRINTHVLFWGKLLFVKSNACMVANDRIANVNEN